MNIHEKPEVGVIPEFKENGLIPPRYSVLTQGSHLFPPPVLSVRNVTAFKGNKTKILPTQSLRSMHLIFLLVKDQVPDLKRHKQDT